MMQVLRRVKEFHNTGVIHHDIKDKSSLITYEMDNIHLKFEFGFGAIFQKGQIYTDRIAIKCLVPPSRSEIGIIKESATV